MILRFLFVVTLVYGTWELTGNRALLLHNGISFIAGIIVATAVLMLLTAFQIFIQYTLDSRSSKIPLTSRIDPVKTPQKLAWTTVLHMLDLLSHAYVEKSTGIDTFLASVIISKLLLSWNIYSDWSGAPVYSSPICLFFLLLCALHQMAIFVSIGVTIFDAMRSIVCGVHGHGHGRGSSSASHFMNFIFSLDYSKTTAAPDVSNMVEGWCALSVTALHNSLFIDIIFDDTASSLSIYRDALVSDVRNCILLGSVGMLGVTASLILPLNVKSSKVAQSQPRLWCVERFPPYLFISLVVYLFSACLLVRSEDLIYYTFQSAILHTCCAFELYMAII